MNTVKKTRSARLLEDEDEDEVLDELDQIDDEEAFGPATYSITSYGADFPVDGLVKRMQSKAIHVPDFQRSYVWSLVKASRFIESLLLGLPVPAIFLAKEDDRTLIVIDGQQRLKTLQFFYENQFPPAEKKEFRLVGVSKPYDSKTINDLSPSEKLTLDDSLIHAIIVKQDSPDEGDEPSSIFHLFERLNTGGVTLSPQEIRGAIFHGPFIDLLDELNKNSDWRTLYGKKSKRLRDQELILRFFALMENGENYEKPMKEFLNAYCRKHRKIGETAAKQHKELFVSTVSAILANIGENAFQLEHGVNAAVTDSVMIGMARRLSKTPSTSAKRLAEKHRLLLEDSDFLKSVQAGTTDEQNVKTRLKMATKAFG